MSVPSFGVRFGYGLWLAHLTTGAAPTLAQVGKAVDRTGQAVGAWLKRDDPPTDYQLHAPLAEFLSVDERWLVKNEGEPPRPDLWAAWLAARVAQAKATRKNGTVLLRLKKPQDVPKGTR